MVVEDNEGVNELAENDSTSSARRKNVPGVENCNIQEVCVKITPSPRN